MNRLLFTDITSSYGDSVGVAGIDLDSGESVRLQQPRPASDLLRREGIVAPGAVVTVTWDRAPGITLPHAEDAAWDPASLRRIGTMPYDGIVKLLARRAFPSIEAAFGPPAFRARTGNAAWEPGEGDRSIATVRALYVRVQPDRRGRMRITMKDAAGGYWRGIPFADACVRAHIARCHDCESPDDLADRLRREFEGNGCLLRVALTRPAPLDDYAEACWLHVTNVLARPRSHFAVPPRPRSAATRQGRYVKPEAAMASPSGASPIETASLRPRVMMDT